MALPYQCLVARAGNATDSDGWTLFGASGSTLVVQSSNGAISLWPKRDAHIRDDQPDDSSQEPPGKRVKLEQPKEQKPNFTNLVLSNSGQHLVGVTGEDKCIRVFQVDSQSHLQQLSERCMSRRPCSVALTSDDSTILCADKFGDVYALPLLLPPEDDRSETLVAEQLEPKEIDYVPAATTLTVHSGRNRKTLEEQLKQKAKGVPKSKEPMKFKHELLLGHVSMLTDIVYTKVDSRSYLITADRDEHIRISRGQPQAHIIEGFCFGHEAFVSRLCLTRPGLLVSGGGDDQLFVWDWQNYRLIDKLLIRDVALSHLISRSVANAAEADDAKFKVAVSGIWNVPRNNGEANEILVACEGIPALFSFTIGAAATGGTAIPLGGNALDVAFIQSSPDSCVVVVSIDNIHTPGSTTEVRDNDKNPPRLQCFSNQQNGQWQEDASTQALLGWFENEGLEVIVERASGGDAADSKSGNGTRLGSADDKAVRDMHYYHVENLRKRPGAED
ncbi:tRNA methyltransferas-like protein [Cucurbitaria berberidis CBS 394.84]|uniref:tRNA methyltransferas-like protein n=1 Tax=Cucurbitaria berberidis CBS 394.84 TaxID=1168544 RepID=A0A9P4L331_9PLEO|nr:tRNA methyltransferas-like protein [Cucurbitaria berberidis CBS 394.84]KAF1839900.1 tRNA methyltransferas-like protein [Cucurbitaria berberidis CBS 394.84]